MKVGSFDVPELRLVPTAMGILEEIYKVKKRARTQSKDLAILLGYKYGTETHFYRKLRTLTEYGLLEGQGSYQVSELGEKLLHPRDEKEKELAKTRAVLNVKLWREIYEKHGKTLREDNFWAVLVDITKTDPDSAKKADAKILKWYLEDIAHVSDALANIDTFSDQQSESEPLRSSSTQSKAMSQQLVLTDMPDNSFGRVQLSKGGYIDVTDEATLEIAKSYIKVLEKKIQEKKSRPNTSPSAITKKPTIKED